MNLIWFSALRIICGDAVVSPLERVPNAVWVILGVVGCAAAATAGALLGRRIARKRSEKLKESEEKDNE